MRVQKKTKAFAYRGTIGDYNYLQWAFNLKLENFDVYLLAPMKKNLIF